MPALLDNLLVFGRLLRRLGLEVHVGRLLDVAAVLPQVNIGKRDDVFHTCRALLVHDREDLPAFDRAFDAFWRLHGDGEQRPDRRRSDVDLPTADQHTGSDGAVEMSVAAFDPSTTDASTDSTGAWSDARRMAQKDFAAFTPDDIAIARTVLDQLEWSPGQRRTRRWVQGRGPRIDLRRALGNSVRTGGDVIKLPTRRRRTRPRPLVLLCDISGSMERYSRMLLHFAHAIARRHRRVEAFVFSTGLTRVTRELRAPRLDEALAEVSRSVADWSGGTRIGEALEQLNQQWSRRALRGGPVVLLISDGWDRGDPTLLRDQIRRLQRRAHRLIWLNPLIGTADYAPLTRGLQAALRFVDDFLPARTLTSLADLAVYLNSLSGGR
jgi:uncharacterized protein